MQRYGIIVPLRIKQFFVQCEEAFANFGLSWLLGDVFPDPWLYSTLEIWWRLIVVHDIPLAFHFTERKVLG